MTTPRLILFASSLLGCTPLWNAAAKETQAVAAKSRERTYLVTRGEQKHDVVYKTVSGRALAIDIYYPTTLPKSKLPTVIYTHGGGWAAGSRMNLASGAHGQAALKLLEAGFCVVSVDYRLCSPGNGVVLRDCVIDSKDAVRYLAKHSGSLGLDPQRFLMLGDSAGGQIAQMLVLTPPESLPGVPELADATYRIVAGVSHYGPCDFERTELFNHDDRPDFRDRFGARIVAGNVTPEEKLRLYREMSPVHYLTKDSPPLLMIQGDQDTTIPVKHAYHMLEKAKLSGAPVEIMIIKNAGHNWRPAGAPIEPTTASIVNRTVSFLLNHSKPT